VLRYVKSPYPTSDTIFSYTRARTHTRTRYIYVITRTRKRIYLNDATPYFNILTPILTEITLYASQASILLLSTFIVITFNSVLSYLTHLLSTDSFLKIISVFFFFFIIIISFALNDQLYYTTMMLLLYVFNQSTFIWNSIICVSQDCFAHSSMSGIHPGFIRGN
jgi:hypothetical protein